MDNLVTNLEPQVRFDCSSDNFYTPDWLVNRINYFYEGCIDLDPCADPLKKIPARNHYCFHDNGLKQKWKGNIFCNPPYSRSRSTSVDRWLAKAMFTYNEGHEILLLLPTNLDTKWGQTILDSNQNKGVCKILFVGGRIKFLNSDYSMSKSPGRFSSMLVYFGRERRWRFYDVFSKYGVIA